MKPYKSKLDNLSPSELRLTDFVETMLFLSEGFYGVRIYREIKKQRQLEEEQREQKKRESYSRFNKEVALNHININPTGNTTSNTIKVAS